MGLVSLYMGVIVGIFGVFLIGGGLYAYIADTLLFIEWILCSFPGGVDLNFLLLIDYISLIFMGVVFLISSIVLIYSSDYIISDSAFYRFILLVVLFVFSILLIVISPNIVRILLGWDGLGLVSYCLIIFYQNEKSASSGIITVLSNRVGDVAILLSIRWIVGYGDWGFMPIIEVYKDDLSISVILGLVILAAITKSAQVPFSAWLPAAIAAPTPVSALVHSSTLVTAGVYLLIRFTVVLGCSGTLLTIRMATMLLSGLGACLEQDAKRIIALSTLRQLGVMMFSLSLGLWEIAYFHLLTHALFKSLLFMCIGLYIHGASNQQDLRGIGRQISRIPLVSCYFFGSFLALGGFPFISGFYSKDLIIELFESEVVGVISFILVLFMVILTIIYSFRLVSYLYAIECGSKVVLRYRLEGLCSTIPIFFLYVLSVVGGSIFGWVFVPLVLVSFSVIGKLIVTFTALGALVSSLAYWLTSQSGDIKLSGRLGFTGLRLIWFLHDLFSLVSLNLVRLGRLVLHRLDQGWVENWGIQGLSRVTLNFTGWVDSGVELGLGLYLLGGFIMVLTILILVYRCSSIRIREWRSLGVLMLRLYSWEVFISALKKKCFI